MFHLELERRRELWKSRGDEKLLVLGWLLAYGRKKEFLKSRDDEKHLVLLMGLDLMERAYEMLGLGRLKGLELRMELLMLLHGGKRRYEWFVLVMYKLMLMEGRGDRGGLAYEMGRVLW